MNNASINARNNKMFKTVIHIIACTFRSILIKISGGKLLLIDFELEMLKLHESLK